MPRTSQRFPGRAIEEDSILFEDRGAATGQVGSVYRVGNTLYGHDGGGEFDLRSGSGISESQHEDLDSLVHNIAEDAFLEVTRDGSGKVTDVIIWTDSNKTTKIRETNITRTSGKVSQIVKKQYDGTGALIAGQTLTGTVARSSGKVASITWVQT